MPRQPLQTIRGCSTDPSWEKFWSILSSSVETSHPHKARSYSHIINSYFPVLPYTRHTQLNPRPVPSFCPGPWLVTCLWAKLCITLFIKKKGGFYEAYHFAQGTSLLSRGKEKVQCVNASPRLLELHVKQKHSAGSDTDNSHQPRASHPGILVVLVLFLMSLMLRIRAQSAVFLACLCSGLHHFKTVNGLDISASSSAKWDNTTRFRIFCRPVFAKHFEKWKVLSKHWVLATEPASRIFKAFYTLSYKSFIPASSANICSGLKTSASVTEMVALVK